MEQYKTCSKCGQTKSIDFYSKKKSGKFGVVAVCKTCCNEKSRLWRAANPEKKKQSNKNWQSRNPDKKRESQRKWEAKNFEKEKLRKRADYLANKAERNAASTEWDRANPEKRRARKQKWRAANPDKVRQQYLRDSERAKQNGICYILPKEFHRLLQSIVCFYCQKTMSKVTIDHVIPRARGGRHSIGNLVASCGSCNFSKGSKTIMEWRVWKMRLDSRA